MRTREFYLSEEWESEVCTLAAKIMFAFQKFSNKPYSIYVNAVTHICYDEFSKNNYPECFAPASILFLNNPDTREYIYTAIDDRKRADMSDGFSFKRLMSKVIPSFLMSAIIILSFYVMFNRFNVLWERQFEIEEMFNVDKIDEDFS